MKRREALYCHHYSTDYERIETDKLYICDEDDDCYWLHPNRLHVDSVEKDSMDELIPGFRMYTFVKSTTHFIQCLIGYLKGQINSCIDHIEFLNRYKS